MAADEDRVEKVTCTFRDFENFEGEKINPIQFGIKKEKVKFVTLNTFWMT